MTTPTDLKKHKIHCLITKQFWFQKEHPRGTTNWMKSLSFFYVQVPKVAQMEYPLIRGILIKIVLQRQVISRFQLNLVCFFFWPNTSLPLHLPERIYQEHVPFLSQTPCLWGLEAATARGSDSQFVVDCLHTAGLDKDVVYHLRRWLEYIFRRLLLHETFDLRRHHCSYWCWVIVGFLPHLKITVRSLNNGGHATVSLEKK